MAEMTRDNQLIEYDDYWVVAPLGGKTVTRCFVDHAFGIEYWDRGRETTIRIEGNFVFRVSGAEHRLSPEQPTALGPALSIIHKAVVSTKVYKGGCLEVNFSDGSGLSVEPDAAYEAWEIVGSGSLRVVCAPEGRLSIWERESDGKKL